MEKWRKTLGLVSVLTLIFLTDVVSAQDRLRGTMTMGSGDIAAIKQQAEAGDPKAQVTLGDSFASQSHPLDALGWYKKAAAQGSVEGAYQTGHLLLFGAGGLPKGQSVPANPPEGVQWTFRAATNLHALALYDMSKAIQRGLGVSSNAVEAYAWMQLYAETGATAGRVGLNEMALKLDSGTIQQG